MSGMVTGTPKHEGTKSQNDGAGSSLFDLVRAACQAVAQVAVHVHIEHDRIPEYAASLPLQVASHPEHDSACHYLGHGADTVAFFITLDAINFMSGYNPHLRKRPGMSGYFTTAAALNDQFRAHGPLSAQQLTQLTAERCAQIFGQDLDNMPIHELMRLYGSALNELGRYLLEQFDGSFMRLLEAARSSAEALVRLLIRMPYFDDVEAYGSWRVPFYKRAQLTAADLAIAFDGKGPGFFHDLDRLTIFADNLVPHVLQVDGILRYEDDLAARIEREELIASGSAEEVEIRACAVHAVELLVAELRRQGRTATAHGLDYLLWNRGQGPYYKARPRHRTRSVYY
jgi:hypothetical protein